MAVHVGNGTSGMQVKILDSTLVELCVGLRLAQLLHCKTSSEYRPVKRERWNLDDESVICAKANSTASCICPE